MSEETKEKVKLVCKGLALLTTLAFLLEKFVPFPKSGVLGDIMFWLLVGLIFIGWIATLVTGPIKVLKKMFKPVATVWCWGMAWFFPVNILVALFGAILTFGLMLFVFAFIPFVLTIGN